MVLQKAAFAFGLMFLAVSDCGATTPLRFLVDGQLTGTVSDGGVDEEISGPFSLELTADIDEVVPFAAAASILFSTSGEGALTLPLVPQEDPANTFAVTAFIDVAQGLLGEVGFVQVGLSGAAFTPAFSFSVPQTPGFSFDADTNLILLDESIGPLGDEGISLVNPSFEIAGLGLVSIEAISDVTFSVTPIPEPTGGFLMAAGAVIGLGRRRRR